MSLSTKNSIELLEKYLSQRQGPYCSWSDQQIREHLRSSEFALKTDKQQLQTLILFRSDQQVLEIFYLETNPFFRGHGLMFKHLSELLSDYRDLEVWLEVSENNHPAIQLYKKLGFRLGSKRPAYYRDGAAALLLSRGSEWGEANFPS